VKEEAPRITFFPKKKKKKGCRGKKKKREFPRCLSSRSRSRRGPYANAEKKRRGGEGEGTLIKKNARRGRVCSTLRRGGLASLKIKRGELREKRKKKSFESDGRLVLVQAKKRKDRARKRGEKKNRARKRREIS